MKKLLFVGFLSVCSLSYAQPQKKTGLLFDQKADEKVSLINKPIGFGDGLPKAVSLAKYAPSVADQGEYGTCVGWSSTYYIATIELAQKLNITDKNIIDNLAFDPFFTYLSIINKSDPTSYSTCENGTFLTDACNFLYINGPKPLNFEKLDCGDELSELKSRRFSMLKMTDYYRVLDEEDSKEDKIVAACQMLANGHPIICGMIVTESLFGIEKSGLFKPTSDEKKDPFGHSYGGHALAIIGYDDDRFGGSFEVINSWGAKWGDQGKFYLKYEDYDLFVHSAFAFETTLVKEEETAETYFGNTTSGYGSKKVLESGFMQGNFENGKLISGVYFNSVESRKNSKLIKKAKKKNSGLQFIEVEDENGTVKVLGYIL